MRVRSLVPGLIIWVCGAPLHAQNFADVPSCPAAREEVEKLWCRGGALFIEHTQSSYVKSIKPYARALALERQHRRLSQSAWRALVDNLGMAYGMTGRLQQAVETFEYGLTQDSTYPMFHYLLADAYAEQGDERRAIENLKLAFAHRANVIQGEQMPDPSTDDSFQRFMHDSTFLAVLRALPRDSH